MRLFRKKPTQEQTKNRLDAIREIHILHAIVDKHPVLAPVASQAVEYLNRGANPLIVRDKLYTFVHDTHEVAKQHQRDGYVHRSIPRNPFER